MHWNVLTWNAVFFFIFTMCSYSIWDYSIILYGITAMCRVFTDLSTSAVTCNIWGNGSIMGKRCIKHLHSALVIPAGSSLALPKIIKILVCEEGGGLSIPTCITSIPLLILLFYLQHPLPLGCYVFGIWDKTESLFPFW